MTNRDKRQIQQLMQDVRWNTVELFLKEYLEQNFIQGSVKKSTEFDTIWDAAFQEGGKYHLQQFFSQLENSAEEAE